MAVAEGEVISMEANTTTIPFTIGNASSVPGFQGYDLSFSPITPGTYLAFDPDTLQGFIHNALPGELYNVTSQVQGTAIVDSSLERAGG